MAYLQEPNPFLSSKFHICIDVHTCTLTDCLKAKGKWGPNCCKECSGATAGHHGMVAGMAGPGEVGTPEVQFLAAIIALTFGPSDRYVCQAPDYSESGRKGQ